MPTLSEQVRELEAKLERGAKVYYDIADATLPSSTGPQDIIAEIRRLREAERAAESRLAQARAEGAREALMKLEAQLEASRDNGIWYGTFVLKKVRDFRDREYPAPASGEQGCEGIAHEVGCACPTPSPVERVTPEPIEIVVQDVSYRGGLTPTRLVARITTADARRIVSLAAQDGGSQ